MLMHILCNFWYMFELISLYTFFGEYLVTCNSRLFFHLVSSYKCVICLKLLLIIKIYDMIKFYQDISSLQQRKLTLVWTMFAVNCKKAKYNLSIFISLLWNGLICYIFSHRNYQSLRVDLFKACFHAVLIEHKENDLIILYTVV